MRVIFLDIDGVLNTVDTTVMFGGVIGIDPDLLDRFLDVKNRCEPVNVVLSSTWRMLPETLEHVKERIPIFDVTPAFRNDFRPLDRGVEVAHWLAEHPEVERYAIIDDHDTFLPEQKENFFHTNMGEGLTEEISERIVAHFDESEPEPAMIFLNGRDRPSFRCNRGGAGECGANVFSKKGNRYTCHACGTVYEGE